MINALTNPFNLLWICLGLHVFSDFVLQILGNLHKFKTESWWDKQISERNSRIGNLGKIGQNILEGINNITDNDKRIALTEKFTEYIQCVKGVESGPTYNHDYIAGMACHCVMWGVVTFFPLMFVVSAKAFSIALLLNILVHGVIDHLKCNKEKINLCTDQILHLIQIGMTIFLCYYQLSL